MHRRPHAASRASASWPTEHGLPLRDRPPVVFKGGFYGQWEYGVSEPEKVSFEALSRILRHRAPARHLRDGRATPATSTRPRSYVYHRDREWERETLADPRLPALLRDQAVELISYHELRRAVACLDGGAA